MKMKKKRNLNRFGPVFSNFEVGSSFKRVYVHFGEV